MASLPNRPLINYAAGEVTDENLVAAVADHDRMRFAGLTSTAASNASNFTATRYITVTDNAGNVLGYLPFRVTTW